MTNILMYVHNGPVHVSGFICTCIMCGKHDKHFNVCTQWSCTCFWFYMYVHNGPVHVSGFICTCIMCGKHDKDFNVCTQRSCTCFWFYMHMYNVWKT